MPTEVTHLASRTVRRFPSRGLKIAGCLTLCALGIFPGGARAAGIEDTVGGAVGLGRAASFGRVNDFMAVLQNPANLAVVPGSVFGGELRLPILRSCFDRAADSTVEYRQTETGELLEHFEQVCNEAGLMPTGNIGWAASFDGWGAGVGFFTPAAVGGSRYGDDTLTTFQPAADEPYQPSIGIESPNRQLGLERSGITAFLLAGLGAQPIPKLRFGLSGGVGFLSVSNKTVVSSRGGTFNDEEIISELRATDWAVPRFNLSAVASPLDSIDLFVVMQYHGDGKANGDMELTANGLQGVPLGPCVTPDDPGSHCEIKDIELTVPFPTLEATFGVRVSQPRAGKQEVLDPLADEVWDFEVDVAWSQTSNVDALGVKIHEPDPDRPEDLPRVQLGNGTGAAPLFVRAGTEVPKNWKDTWTLRAGGDVNAIQDQLALRAGVSYATSAVRDGYMNIDFWPVRKIGLHAGATLAIKSFRIIFAYAHLFYESVVVDVGNGEVRDIATNMENLSTAVNEGRYDAVQDILSVQVNAHF